MRSIHVVVLVAGLAMWPGVATAQEPARPAAAAGAATSTATMTTASGGTYTVTTRDQEKPAAKPRMIEPPSSGRWVRTLTNVQIELTISDQTGAGTPEKKTVSMVVSSGAWGKIRSAQMVRDGGRDHVVDLNVDARPMVSVDGPIQLELTVVYSPPGPQTGDAVRVRPTGVNQSLTVILQSGKPLVISQAADPVGDRKIIVEAKATVLK